MAQSVERPTLAQVMISRFVGLSTASGSVLTAQNLEAASDSVSPSFSAPSLLMLYLCVKNKTLKKAVRKTTREYYEETYSKNLDNLDGMGEFLETQNVPRINHEETNSKEKSNEVESVVKILPEKSPEPEGFTGVLYQTREEEY